MNSRPHVSENTVAHKSVSRASNLKTRGTRSGRSAAVCPGRSSLDLKPPPTPRTAGRVSDPRTPARDKQRRVQPRCPRPDRPTTFAAQRLFAHYGLHLSREGRALVRCILPQQRGGVDGPAIDRLGEGVPSGLESADAQPRKKGRDEGRHQDSAAGLGRGARARTRAHDFRRAGRRRVLMASVLQHLQPSSYMRFSDLSASYVLFSNLSSLLPSARFCTNVGARVRTKGRRKALHSRCELGGLGTHAAGD